MAPGLILGPGSISQAQLVAFTSVAVVIVFLLVLNMAVCLLYRRTRQEDQRRAKKSRQKKQCSMYVYHMHRTFPCNGQAAHSASQQIRRKLQQSNDKMHARMAAQDQQEEQENGEEGGERNSAQRRRREEEREEEERVLEELEVTADLFWHETSNASSLRSTVTTAPSPTSPSHGQSNRTISTTCPTTTPTSPSSFLHRRLSANSTSATTTAAAAPNLSTMSDLDLQHTSRDLQHENSDGRSVSIVTDRESSAGNLQQTTGVTSTFDSAYLHRADCVESLGDSSLHDLNCVSTMAICQSNPITGHHLDRASSADFDLDILPAGQDDLDDLHIASDIDMMSALNDLDSALSDADLRSMSSVTMADFNNDDDDDVQNETSRKRGSRGSGGSRKGRSPKHRKSSSGSMSSDQHGLPVAEFHNEAFDFADRKTAVERVRDVEL